MRPQASLTLVRCASRKRVAVGSLRPERWKQVFERRLFVWSGTRGHGAGGGAGNAVPGGVKFLKFYSDGAYLFSVLLPSTVSPSLSTRRDNFANGRFFHFWEHTAPP
ncbi:hypothetical protein GUJ93_ZPchr0003g18445 [Zizania palustris]|uniref:Uncharacterized protein n=1 Tax=Zizania palustris TaxID=103762 RepID=A0A8J5VVS7_ZIZPA|nr:hypothetical protein GUJ93_ZPchr0003g18445 [Zizania palustris]